MDNPFNILLALSYLPPIAVFKKGLKEDGSVEYGDAAGMVAKC